MFKKTSHSGTIICDIKAKRSNPGKDIKMNNDFNNFNRNDERRQENGVGNEDGNRTVPEADNTPDYSNGAQNTSESMTSNPMPPEYGNDMQDKNGSAENNGDYRYTGNGLGDRGRDDTTGSYTHRGSYSPNGYDNRNGASPQNPNGMGYGGWNQPPYRQYGENPNYPHSPMNEPYPPQKHKKNGVSKAALAVTVAVCILLSSAAGFGGAYMYNRLNGSGGNLGASENLGVLHRVVETDESTSTGDKGIYTDVCATVKDSVVEITTEFKVTGFFQYVSEGAGSGVIISDNGYIITNNHVITSSDSGKAADTINVRLTNGNEYKAELVGKDADSDIAVIKIEPDEELSFAVFGDSDKLTVGEEVIAVGNPLGELGGTITNGIISALDREINVDGTPMNLLQTNAAINPGNSGGGLFNMKGELVGVVNAKSSGSGIEGLGFAIPANDAYEVSEQLMANGYVTGKVYIGVSFYDVSDAFTAYRYFKSQATGVYVVDLVEGYNDENLKYGDRIVAVDGNEITEFSQIKDLLKDHSVGDILEFTVYRSGKLTDVKVECFEYVPEDASVNFEAEEG